MLTPLRLYTSCVRMHATTCNQSGVLDRLHVQAGSSQQEEKGLMTRALQAAACARVPLSQLQKTPQRAQQTVYCILYISVDQPVQDVTQLEYIQGIAPAARWSSRTRAQ